MYVYILGGFLGSGKTTLLMKIASMYSQQKRQIAILVNEAGQVGVDGNTLRAQGYDAIELPDGCICCSLAGTLQDAITNIKEDIDPEVLIIEPTGLALPHKVEELVRYNLEEEDESFIIGVMDIQRFEDLIKKKEEFFKRQMLGTEFILINKSDIAVPEKLEEAKAFMKEKFPGKPVFAVSTKTGAGMEQVYEMMK